MVRHFSTCPHNFKNIINSNDVEFSAVHANIQAAIDNLPATGGWVRLPENTSLNGSTAITINKPNVTLQGGGRNTVITLDAGANCNVIDVTADDVTIRDLHIDGNGGNQTAVSDGIVVASGAEHCTIENVEIEDCYRQAIRFTIAAVYHSHMVLDSKIHHNLGNGAGGEGAIRVQQGWRVIVANCWVAYNSNWGICVAAGNEHIFDSNIVEQNTNGGMYIIGSEETITGGSVSFNDGVGIYLAAGDGVLISGVTVMGNVQEGIQITGAEADCIVENCVLRHNSFGQNNVDDEILIDGNSKEILIHGNSIGTDIGTYYHRYCIAITAGCVDVFILDNILYEGQTGVILDGGTGTWIERNHGNVEIYQTTANAWAAYGGPTGVAANGTKVVVYSSGEPGHRLYCYSNGAWHYVNLT